MMMLSRSRSKNNTTTVEKKDSQIIKCSWCDKELGYYITKNQDSNKKQAVITSKKESILSDREEIVHICDEKGKLEVFCEDHIIEHVRWVPCKYIH